MHSARWRLLVEGESLPFEDGSEMQTDPNFNCPLAAFVTLSPELRMPILDLRGPPWAMALCTCYEDDKLAGTADRLDFIIVKEKTVL